MGDFKIWNKQLAAIKNFATQNTSFLRIPISLRSAAVTDSCVARWRSSYGELAAH